MNSLTHGTPFLGRKCFISKNTTRTSLIVIHGQNEIKYRVSANWIKLFNLLNGFFKGYISFAGGKRRNQTLCYHEKLSTRSSWTKKKPKKKKTNNKTIKLSKLSFWNFKTWNTILGCIVNCDIINYNDSCQYVTIYSMITNFPENTRDFVA